MNTIHINASIGYDVHIGCGILSNIGTYLTNITNYGKAVIISDSNVFPFWGQALSNALKEAGFAVSSFIFHAGEQSKNQNTLFDILHFLAENEFSRTDLLVALGGGVVGDITGFAASIYLRGVPYIQVPTSLLAMVDSSVGGKTAIDLPAGKNLVGAFYQPKLVLCDLDVLNTLPKKVFLDGCAEIIKYGVLFDHALFQHLSSFGAEFERSYVISRCIELKRDVVNADEFDRGLRQKLNLGHTIGHGIEKQSSYTITHGNAVAAGMAIITKAAWKYGYSDEVTYRKICSVLQTFGLPISTIYNSSLLYTSILSDKKRNGTTVNFIIPKAIGECIISPIAIDNIQTFIEAGL